MAVIHIVPDRARVCVCLPPGGVLCAAVGLSATANVRPRARQAVSFARMHVYITRRFFPRAVPATAILSALAAAAAPDTITTVVTGYRVGSRGVRRTRRAAVPQNRPPSSDPPVPARGRAGQNDRVRSGANLSEPGPMNGDPRPPTCGTSGQTSETTK